MKNLESILKDYEADIKYWADDFGEGHLFLEHREKLIPFETDERVTKFDKEALKVIESDNSKGSDKFFLEQLKDIINGNIAYKAA